MRICYVTTDSLSEGVGSSQIIPLLIGVARAGHEVTIVSMEKFESSDVRGNLQLAGITWKPLDFGKQGLIPGAFRLLRLIREIPEADVFHARSDIPAIALIIRGKSPILWDVRSLWMEQRVVMSGNKLALKFLNKIWIHVEKFISGRSAAINTLASELQPTLVERLGKIPELKTVIPTAVNLDAFPFVKKLPIDKTVMMSGTFNKFYDKDLTEFVMQSLVEMGYQATWCRPKESLSNSLRTSDLKIYEVKHEDMPSRIAVSTIGVAVCRDDVGVSLKGVMPTKVAEFLATGRPVIASKGMGDLDRFLTEYQAGVLVDKHTSKEELYRAVEALLSDPNTPMRCRKLAEDKFDMARGIRSYLTTYSEMLAKVS